MIYWSKILEETGKLREASEALKKVFFTLQCMARGGIHDHVGGGFHRYSVDECWHGQFFFRAIYYHNLSLTLINRPYVTVVLSATKWCGLFISL